MNEGGEHLERREILQGDVVKIIRDLGPENTQAQAMYRKWEDQEKRKVNLQNSSLANMYYNIAVAEIALDSEQIEIAIGAFDDAGTAAHQEGEKQLAGELKDEANRLREASPNSKPDAS